MEPFWLIISFVRIFDRRSYIVSYSRMHLATFPRLHQSAIYHASRFKICFKTIIVLKLSARKDCIKLTGDLHASDLPSFQDFRRFWVSVIFVTLLRLI